MKFSHRFAYYLVGLIMGCFFVAAVFSGKDTRCNYFPNARVLNDLRNKPFYYSDNASQVLAEKWIDTIDIKNCLKYGDVEFLLGDYLGREELVTEVLRARLGELSGLQS